jgi:hypothetical protein
MKNTAETASLRIGELSKATGIGHETIRYYEKIGFTACTHPTWQRLSNVWRITLGATGFYPTLPRAGYFIG